MLQCEKWCPNSLSPILASLKSHIVEGLRSSEVEATNLYCCPLFGGDGLSPTCYLGIYPAFGRFRIHWTLLYSTNGEPNRSTHFLILLPLFCLSVCLLCFFYLSLSLAVVSDQVTGTKSSSSSLLWLWQNVLTLGLISHHGCDDNFRFYFHFFMLTFIKCIT